MENNAAEDPNLSFIQKQDLERYSPTAIKKAAAGSAEMAKAIFSAISNVPLGIASTVVKALDAILPDEDPEVKAKLISNTEAAVERGVFGIPTFFVGDEMFFGKDTLWQIEELLSK